MSKFNVSIKNSKTTSVNASGCPNSCLVNIEKQKFRALVDSGAECSLMHERVFKMLKNRPKLSKKSINLQTAGQTSLNVLGCVNIKIRVGGTEMHQEFCVVNNLNRNLILGFDWLKHNDVRVYFDLKCMRIHGKTYVRLEEDIHVASTVRMKSNELLRPNSAKICYGKIREHPDLRPGDLFDVSQIENGFLINEPGLKIINSVAKLTRDRTVPLLVVNSTNKFYKIRRHGLVAKLSSTAQKNVRNVDSVLKENTLSSTLDLGELDVPDKHRSQMESLIKKNRDLFAKTDSELGYTDVVKMKIDTGDHEPIKLRPYRTPINNRKIIDKAIDEMLDAGVIEKSRSPWSFPVVIVDKKDGSKRFCVDFRKLNQITKKNSYPLPLIDDILVLLGGAKYFTSLDLKSGYWQVAMSEEDKEKTAFTTTHRGLHQFTRMPFGLSNAPSIFQEVMSHVLEGYRNFTTAYLDDILIFSSTLEEHLKHIDLVFERLRSHGLKLKLKKCSFLKTETNYLGFVINTDGIKPDQKKVEAIRSLPSPTCVKEVRSFIGMCSYYRRFIPNFSKIAEPIITLTKKHAHFKWSEGHQQAFDYLKDSLTVVPLLSYPNPNLPYVLYCDASDTCIGSCLTQMCDGEEKPIYYLSHKLSKSQCSWSTVVKEAYSIHYSLQKLDFYLHNAEFVIKTDHAPLKYLLNSPMQNKKIQLWALTMSGYNCTVEYIPGTTNTCADLLSRHPGKVNTLSNDDECAEVNENNTLANDVDVNDNLFEINVLDSTHFNPKEFASCNLPETDNLKKPDGTDLITGHDSLNMVDEQSKDEVIVDIKKLLLSGDGNKELMKHHIIVDDIVYYLSNPEDDPWLRLFVPSHLKHLVIKQYHDDNGHMGVQKTFDSIKQKYYWQNLFKEIHSYVGDCVLCKTRSLQKVKQPLQETDIPPYPFAKISLDLSGPYVQSLSGNKYIIAFVDWFSGWPEAFPVKDKSAQTVAQLLIEEIFPRFGCPLAIVTDNGTENCNKIVEEALKILKIDHILTSVYHPQSNAKVERFHRTMHDILSKKLSDRQETWDLNLNQTLAAIRFNISESAKYSPFFLLYNRDVVLPIDNILKPRRKYQGEDLHLISLEEQHKAFVRVRNNLKKAKKRQAKYADKGTKTVEFEVGDPVYYKKQKRGKLDHRWSPYYRIIEKTGPVSYVISNQLTGATSRVHAEHLRLANIEDWQIHKQNDEKVMRKAAYVMPPESSSDSEQSDVTDSDENFPLARLVERYRQERSDSDDEDDIPLMELSKRLKGQESSDIEIRESSDDDTMSVAENKAFEDDQMSSMDINEISQIVKKDKTESVKQLFKLISELL